MKYFFRILVLGLFWCNIAASTILTNANEIFKAKLKIREGKTYNGKTGYIFQWGKEKYPDGLLTLPVKCNKL